MLFIKFKTVVSSEGRKGVRTRLMWIDHNSIVKWVPLLSVLASEGGKYCWIAYSRADFNAWRQLSLWRVWKRWDRMTEEGQGNCLICSASDPVTVLLFTLTQVIRMPHCLLSLTFQWLMSSVDKTLRSEQDHSYSVPSFKCAVYFYSKIHFPQKF